MKKGIHRNYENLRHLVEIKKNLGVSHFRDFPFQFLWYKVLMQSNVSYRILLLFLVPITSATIVEGMKNSMAHPLTSLQLN